VDNTTRYLNFVKNYNKALAEKGTDWLGPEDLGKVLLDTARENNAKSKIRPLKSIPPFASEKRGIGL